MKTNFNFFQPSFLLKDRCGVEYQTYFSLTFPVTRLPVSVFWITLLSMTHVTLQVTWLAEPLVHRY